MSGILAEKPSAVIMRRASIVGQVVVIIIVSLGALALALLVVWRIPEMLNRRKGLHGPQLWDEVGATRTPVAVVTASVLAAIATALGVLISSKSTALARENLRLSAAQFRETFELTAARDTQVAARDEDTAL